MKSTKKFRTEFRATRMTIYQEKLRHPKWQEKRLRIMDRANFTCEWCGSKDKPLHVHHGYYERGREPWDYPDDTLYCICEDCHPAAESLKLAVHKKVAVIHPMYLRECAGAIGRFKLDVDAGRVSEHRASSDNQQPIKLFNAKV